MLRSVLVAAFSAMVAFGALGGLSEMKAGVLADSHWPSVATDNVLADSHWPSVATDNVLADSHWPAPAANDVVVTPAADDGSGS
ncbi:hypothetical protein [Streptomyces fagopyri]|uniref:hypothetical protein n=1 Tax=Streptomyces fagopyri TaxID=2662397 RepID=UPI003712DD9F